MIRKSKYLYFFLVLFVLSGCTKVVWIYPSNYSVNNNSVLSNNSQNSNVNNQTTNVISNIGIDDYIYVEPYYSGSYYNGINSSLRENGLVLALYNLMNATKGSGFSYSGHASVFPYTDADPKNPSSGKILSFYSGTPSTWSSMNREHVWPNSRGGNHIESDPHVIRPTITSENSSRGNDFFNLAPTKWDPASFNNEKYRGIAARIIFYGAVKGQANGLNLADTTQAPTANKSMGKLSLLLEWNLTYDIDDTEILRNDVLQNKYNHSRNPFIDNRNYACLIWGNTNDQTRSICGKK